MASEEDTTEYAYIGISACFSILCIGTVLSYSLQILAQRFPLYAKYFRLPTESWLWTVLGLVTGFALQFSSNRALVQVVKIVDDSFPSIFFTALLPPIIFESGYALDVASFRRSFWPALVLAGPGTILSALVIGLILFITGLMKLSVTFGFVEAFILGTIASATDTVSVLTTLEEGVVRQDVSSLIFGESVLNDAVALVMYRTLSVFQVRESAITIGSMFWGCFTFFTTFIFSSLIGITVGVLAALLFKHFRLNTLRSDDIQQTDRESTPTSPIERSESLGALESNVLTDERELSSEVERTLYTCIPFLSYFFAESCYQSGVVSALFCGIIMGKTAQLNISSGTRRFAKSFFRLLSNLFEALVFVYIGIAFPQLFSEQIQRHWSTAVILLVACLIGRAAGVYACSALVNNIERREFEYQRGGAQPLNLSEWPLRMRQYIVSVFTEIQSFFRNPTRFFQALPNLPETSADEEVQSVRITKNASVFLWWCGLRGGVAYALAQHARQIVDTDKGDAMSISVLFMCVISLICIPPAISPLANRLHLNAESESINPETSSENDLLNEKPAEKVILLSKRETKQEVEETSRRIDDSLSSHLENDEVIRQEEIEKDSGGVADVKSLPESNERNQARVNVLNGGNAAAAARAARAVVSAAAAAVPSRAQIKASVERNLHKAFLLLTIDNRA
jgi:NhaP-type Na+/H+ or K+/H+ antiporter